MSARFGPAQGFVSVAYMELFRLQKLTQNGVSQVIRFQIRPCDSEPKSLISKYKVPPKKLQTLFRLHSQSKSFELKGVQYLQGREKTGI